MAVVGAVLVPNQQEKSSEIVEKLKSFPEAEVKGVSDKGIALVLEGESLESLKRVTETIQSWEEVREVYLAYVNWE